MCGPARYAPADAEACPADGLGGLCWAAECLAFCIPVREALGTWLPSGLVLTTGPMWESTQGRGAVSLCLPVIQ